MSRLAYIPEGPRADALMEMDRRHAVDRAAGIPGKVSIFRVLLGGLDYYRVMVTASRPSPTFDPLAAAEPYRTETFEAIDVQCLDDAGRKLTLYAYVNEPRHLEEFLLKANPQRYMVTVRDVRRPALEAAPGILTTPPAVYIPDGEAESPGPVPPEPDPARRT